MNEKVSTLYFSATGTTKTIVSKIAMVIAGEKEESINEIDFTLPENRESNRAFAAGEIVVVGVPVYAGRVPNVLLNYLNTVQGNGALAIPIVLYGNRNYDDALIELKDLLELNDFKVVAAGAFIGEHAFSTILARNRPDRNDLLVAGEFAKQIQKKMEMKQENEELEVKGEIPYRKYYRPKDSAGNFVDIRKVKPKTNTNCTNCKICVELCPMGSIDSDDITKFNGICIKCGACVKKCPEQARYYDDEAYLRHKSELEIEFSNRREPELFL